MKGKFLKVLAVIALFFGVFSAPASAATGPSYLYFGTDNCSNYQTNNSCDWYTSSAFRLDSTNGADRLVFQTDGNFVGYYNSNNGVWFNSHTAGDPRLNNGNRLSLQADCNVVVYDTSGSYARAIWSAGTSVGQSVHACKMTMGGNGTFSVWDYYNGSGWSLIKTISVM